MELKQAVITSKGREVMTQLLSGQQATFTRIVVSDTVYNDSQLASLTNISNIKAETPVTVSIQNANTIVAIGAINNEQTTTGYYINTVGLYIKNASGTEVLYSVAQAVDGKNGYIPANTGVSKSGIQLKMFTEVGVSNNINITVDSAGVATLGDLDRMKKPYQAWANSADGKTDFTKINIKNIMPDSYDSGVTVKFLTDIYSDTVLGQVPLGAEVTQVNATIEVDGSTVDTGLALRCVFLDKDNAFINQTIGSFSANRFKGTLTFTAKKPVNAVAVSFRLARNFELSNFSVFAKRFMVTTNNVSANIYLSGKKSDRTNAFMKYTGFSNKDSNDYRDYTWVRSDEALGISYEAWANDKAGKDFSTIYPRENLVRGNVDGFKYWNFFKDSSATNSTGTKEGRTLTVTSTDTAWKQWRMTGTQGSTELSDLGAGTYILSLDARALDDSAVNTKVDIDFRLNKKDGSYVRISSNRVGITKTALRILTTIIVRNEDLIDVVDKTIVLNYQELGKVEFSKIKLEKGDTQSMYIPSSKDTGVKANELVPMYRGISNSPSQDYLDYVWDKSEQYRDAELQQIRTAIIALGGTV